MKKIQLLGLVLLFGSIGSPTGSAQTAAPKISPGGIVNAASFVAAPNNPGSPCALVSIFGVNLAVATGSASRIPLPLDINGTQVFVNNIAAPLIFVSRSQVNAQIPCEATPGSTVNVVVQVLGNLSTAEPVQVGATAPGVFTLSQNGTGAGAILHANFAAVNSSSPAVPGETILIFCTGLGDTVSPRPQTGAGGAGQATLQTPTVSIGGQSAQVRFSGAAPGFVGLYQINAVMPNVSAGDQSLIVSSSGRQSRPAVTVRVGSAPSTGPTFSQLHIEGTFLTGNQRMPCGFNIYQFLGPPYLADVDCEDYSNLSNPIWAIITGFTNGQFTGNTLNFNTLLDTTGLGSQVLSATGGGTITAGSMTLTLDAFSLQANVTGTLRIVVRNTTTIQGTISGRITSIR